MMKHFEEFSSSDDEASEPELFTVMYKRDDSSKLRSFKMFSHRNSGEATLLKHFAQQLMRYENRKKHRPKVKRVHFINYGYNRPFDHDTKLLDFGPFPNSEPIRVHFERSNQPYIQDSTEELMARDELSEVRAVRRYNPEAEMYPYTEEGDKENKDPEENPFDPRLRRAFPRPWGEYDRNGRRDIFELHFA